MKYYVKPETFAWLPGLVGPFTTEEVTQFYLFATVAGVTAISLIWFFFTTLFYESSSPEYKTRVEAFFKDLKTPVGELTAEQVKENHKVVGAIGILCMIFGSFVLLLLIVPNEMEKRLGFLFCGGSIVTVGWLLRRISKRHEATTKSFPIQQSL
jgi:uncharacterized BrkB/YihY/UPF0761 family membrane protein